MFYQKVNLTYIPTLIKVDIISVFFYSYGRFLEGTGSILRVKNENEIDEEKNDSTIEISRNSIRFFSPKEIANLHCFPDQFGE